MLIVYYEKYIAAKAPSTQTAHASVFVGEVKVQGHGHLPDPLAPNHVMADGDCP